MASALRKDVDAVVVGAGPAGSAAAIQLARAGWSVALVEKQRFPRRKVCGECIAASNLPLLHTLGIGADFDAHAGPDLCHVTLMQRDREVTAALPSGEPGRFAWGRALGRDTLDTLLLAQARCVGAEVLQPWAVQALRGTAGAWQCDLRDTGSAALMHLRAPIVIDAHGCWEALPADRPPRRRQHAAADLFAFKANFTGSSLPAGTISVLALDGGYGGMVLEAGGVITLACCIRRDRLDALRRAAPGRRAGDVVEGWLERECAGVRRALFGSAREGPWLASGPLDPGVRVATADGLFRVGNAAGEAHPILGEGLSMALQSAVLLCSHLLGERGFVKAPTAAAQAALQRRYAADWQRDFKPRLRLATAFAHAAMRPASATLLLALARAWPGLLTQGARWGGKVRPTPPPTRHAQPAQPIRQEES